MNDMSTHELVSIAVQSAEGKNTSRFQDALTGLREKPREDLLQGISSIIIHLKQKGINGSFMESAEQIFNTLK